MNIDKLMQEMHDASNEVEKEIVVEKIKGQFSSLSDSDKELVKKEFLKLWDEKLEETKLVLERIDIYISRMAHETSLKIA